MSLRRARHVPTRQCAACGTIRPKRELVRVVRTPEGNVTVDPTGRQNGRGVYICPTSECRTRAATSERLAQRLGTSVPDHVRLALQSPEDG